MFCSLMSEGQETIMKCDLLNEGLSCAIAMILGMRPFLESFFIKANLQSREIFEK